MNKFTMITALIVIICFTITALIIKSMGENKIAIIILVIASFYSGIPIALVHNAGIDKENEAKYGKQKAKEMKKEFDEFDKKISRPFF